jgi:hypothetical protein
MVSNRRNKRHAPKKPVWLCQIPRVPFGYVEYSVVNTSICFPRLYKRGGSTNVDFSVVKLLWEDCIYPAIAACNPCKVDGLPKKIDRMKTIGKHARERFGDTFVSLTFAERQNFLAVFKTRLMAHDLFTDWFFVHDVWANEEANHNAADEEALSNAWNQWTEDLEIEREQEKWMILLKYKLSVPHQVLLMKHGQYKELLRIFLPHLSDEDIDVLADKQTTVSTHHNFFGASTMETDCSLNNKLEGIRNIRLFWTAGEQLALDSSEKFLPGHITSLISNLDIYARMCQRHRDWNKDVTTYIEVITPLADARNVLVYNGMGEIFEMISQIDWW